MNQSPLNLLVWLIVFVILVVVLLAVLGRVG